VLVHEKSQNIGIVISWPTLEWFLSSDGGW